VNPDQPSPTVVSFGADVLDRMVLAVEKVRERLLRSTGALEAAGVPYAVAGGNAVAAWVSKIDPAAARNTVDVDLLVRRDDLAQVKSALESVGFVYANVFGVDVFLDGPQGNPRDAVHLLYAGEKVKAEYREAAPDLTALERHDAFRIVTLESLVRMKLTSFRRKDQVHVLDMIEVGLVDASWPARLPAELGSRLQELLDNPE
jgi:hypothetical protein